MDYSLTITRPIPVEAQMVLRAYVTFEEVHQAVRDHKPFKAPGPDGLHPVFYQRYWMWLQILFSILLGVVFQNGNVPLDSNETLISLIPKCACPETISQFRPDKLV